MAPPLLPLPTYPGKTSYCSHSPAAGRHPPPSAAWGLKDCCLALPRSGTLLWGQCSFCTSYPALAQVKVLKEDLLLEEFKHHPANFSGNGEGVVHGNSSSGRWEGKGWLLPPGRWKIPAGSEVASLLSASVSTAAAGRGCLSPRIVLQIRGRLISNLISSFSSLRGWIWGLMKHESYPMKEVRNTATDAYFMEIIWERWVQEPWLKSFCISVFFLLHTLVEWRRQVHCFVWISAVPKIMNNFW